MKNMHVQTPGKKNNSEQKDYLPGNSIDNCTMGPIPMICITSEPYVYASLKIRFDARRTEMWPKAETWSRMKEGSHRDKHTAGDQSSTYLASWQWKHNKRIKVDGWWTDGIEIPTVH